MAAHADDFVTFVRKISLPADQARACDTAFKEMQALLQSEPEIKEVLVATFLQGSLKRATCVAPANGEKSDVDLVVATRISEVDHSPPTLAWQRFAPFLEKHFGKLEQGRWKPQGRSVRVSYPDLGGGVELDLVLTSAPSEAVVGLLQNNPTLDDPSYDPLVGFEGDVELLRKAASFMEGWQVAALRIPDRERQVWENTDPLEQIRWTRRKNALTNGLYTQVVMALKWWQRCREDLVRPKGYTLEAIVGHCCPDHTTDLGRAIADTLDRIATAYEEDVARERVPTLPDVGTGLNVLSRVEFADFKAFHTAAREAAGLARHAVLPETTREDACRTWGLLFGAAFPKHREPLPPPPPPPSRPPLVTSPDQPAKVTPTRFA